MTGLLGRLAGLLSTHLVQVGPGCGPYQAEGSSKDAKGCLDGIVGLPPRTRPHNGSVTSSITTGLEASRGSSPHDRIASTARALIADRSRPIPVEAQGRLRQTDMESAVAGGSADSEMNSTSSFAAKAARR